MGRLDLFVSCHESAIHITGRNAPLEMNKNVSNRLTSDNQLISPVYQVLDRSVHQRSIESGRSSSIRSTVVRARKRKRGTSMDC